VAEVLVQLADCISLSLLLVAWMYSGKAHSSTASSGPLVLRRGNGCEMLRPWRRTLPDGEMGDAILD